MLKRLKDVWVKNSFLKVLNNASVRELLYGQPFLLNNILTPKIFNKFSII